MRRRRSHADTWRYKRPYKYLQDKVDIPQKKIWLNLDIAAQPPLVSALFPGPAASPPEEKQKNSVKDTLPLNKPDRIRCGLRPWHKALSFILKWLD